jgi:NAD(P)-dependent dehydrogenase (short-subunit alcohol dehydrogenase family)
MKTRKSRSDGLFDLTGKVALVTGGGRGIGRALATGLAQFGCDIAVVDINPRDQNKVVKAVEKEGRKCLFMAASVSDFQSINEAVEITLSRFRKIDILVNNAGVDIRKPALDFTEKEWDLIIDTNMKGAFLTTQAVGKFMTRKRQGKIINIASIMGLVGSPPFQEIVPYCASKGGVVQLTKSFALEWAKYNVHVNAIAPGPIKTNLMKPLLKDRKSYEAVLRMVPLGRFGNPGDLVGPTVFLASKASDYVTGHILFAEGGWLAQ